MSLIIYANSCIPCTHRHDFKLVKKFAKTNNLNVTVRRVAISKDWQEEAQRRSDIDLPYVYNSQNGSSVRLKGVSLEELSRLR